MIFLFVQQIASGSIPLNLAEIDADIEIGNIELEAVEMSAEHIADEITTTEEVEKSAADKTILSPGIVGVSTRKKTSTPSIARLSAAGETTVIRTCTRVKSAEGIEDSCTDIPVMVVVRKSDKAKNIMKKVESKNDTHIVSPKGEEERLAPAEETLVLPTTDVSTSVCQTPQGKRKADSTPMFTPTPRKRSSRAAAMNHAFIKVRPSDGQLQEVKIKEENIDDDAEYMKYKTNKGE